MAIQTTYSETMDRARVGMIADTNNKTLISRLAEETIPFGVAVAQGTEDRQVKLPAAGESILGISVRERSAPDDQWAVTESVRIMSGEGTIFVAPVAGVVVGDVVHGLVGGGISNTGGVVIANARFEDSGAAGDLVRVRIS